MKKQSKQLDLRLLRETVRRLGDDDLKAAVGGAQLMVPRITVAGGCLR